MTRSEHLEWSKQRALEHVDMGDASQAFTSMVSDLGKHPETAGHTAILLGTMLLMSDKLSSPREMRRFILGFG